MKKLFALLLLTALLGGFVYSALASKPLDEITKYEVSVTPRDDGTLDIRYHLEWKVLDDEKEGPLTWVKVGIPNEHMDGISTQSVSIQSIRYLMDNGGDYVRIDLDRAYRAGETVTIDFQLHQSCMYYLNKQGQTIIYTYTPGWFEEIEVKAIIILWEKKGAVQSNAHDSQDTVFRWQSALKPGEKLTASVIYPMDALKVAPEDEREKEEESTFPLGGAILIATGIGFLFYWLSRLSGGGYRGGFGGGHGGSAGVSHSCVCACACACGCACACACAGGGRAGCAAKSFYISAISTEKIQKVLNTNIHRIS